MIVGVHIDHGYSSSEYYLEVDANMDRMWQYEGAWQQLTVDRQVEWGLESFIKYLRGQGIGVEEVTPKVEGWIEL